MRGVQKGTPSDQTSAALMSARALAFACVRCQSVSALSALAADVNGRQDETCGMLLLLQCFWLKRHIHFC